MDSSLCKHLLLIALSLPSVALAQSTASSSHVSSPSSTGAFPTMSAQDGLGVGEGGVGSVVNSTDPGSDGADTGSINLSTGAIVGIAVAIAIVVIALIAMWALWFIAKRRSWTIRETLRRASRRVTGRRAPPPTPRVGNRRQATVYGVKDVERDTGRTKPKASETVATPTAGWLANEKERSRSRSPVSPIEPSGNETKPAKKLGLGRK